jgi:hypothetical protein
VPEPIKAQTGDIVSDLGFHVERVTGIEPALSAWESVQPPQFRAAELGIRVSANDRGCLSFSGANGTLMAR